MLCCLLALRRPELEAMDPWVPPPDPSLALPLLYLGTLEFNIWMCPAGQLNATRCSSEVTSGSWPLRLCPGLENRASALLGVLQARHGPRGSKL